MHPDWLLIFGAYVVVMCCLSGLWLEESASMANASASHGYDQDVDAGKPLVIKDLDASNPQNERVSSTSTSMEARMLTVGLVNRSSKVTPADLQAAAHALTLQLQRDFGPHWWVSAQLVIRGAAHVGEPTLYLFDNPTIAGALGYHDDSPSEPEGFVFVLTAAEYGIPWQSVLSHELLELLADPWIDLAADTVYQGVDTLVFQEICDPVESDSYLINGIPVSNFVLPTWYLPGPVAGIPHTDFLRRLTLPLTMTPGGYFSYAQALGAWQQTFADKAQAKPHDKDYGPFARGARRKKK